MRWSSNDLATKSGIGVATIKRFELMQGVPVGNIKSLSNIQNAFESAGIEFIGTPEDRPGVRLSINYKIK
ncbi:hypothetical protein [Ferrovum sp. PN-J185]|uniref:hypothetical protein n=1 Tax=Ferrovum sp. PN-J185 TaxID=1356306 RepID=UPI00079C6096|nr:hypothetical protein [Ferrovum sp. PN-J185]KXW55826.1 hypothetical protein FV185_09860 [Ferrovum sp. PN-J185]